MIAAFLAQSCSNLGMDQELQEDEYEDTKEEEFVASIAVGKVLRTGSRLQYM